MSQRDDETLLRDMLVHARLAIEVSTDRSRTDLDSDVVFRSAVERLVQVVGEAASRINPMRRGLISGVPWEDIIGMRNRLVHGYAEIDRDVIWATLSRDLPDLIDRIATHLDDE